MKWAKYLLFFVIFLPMVGSTPTLVVGTAVWEDDTPFIGVVRLANFEPPNTFWFDLSWSPSARTNADGSFMIYAEPSSNGYVLLLSEGGDGEYSEWYILWEDDGSFWKIIRSDVGKVDLGRIIVYADTISNNIDGNECRTATNGKLLVCSKK